MCRKATHYRMTVVSSVGAFAIEPPQNVTLTVTGHDKLKIRWSPPPKLAVTHYVVIFLAETFHVDPSTDLVMELESLMTFTTYNCCVVANTTSGPSRMACATQTTLETAPGDAPLDTHVTTINSTAIHIQWDPPLTPNGIIILYTIYIDDVPLLNISAPSGTQNTSVGGFSPHQLVKVRLSASTEVGEGPLTVSQTVTTHEAVPGAVESLSITTSSNSLHIMWHPPLYPNGVLTGYRIMVTNFINATETISFTVGPNSRELIIDSGICPYVRYSVCVAASTSVGPGDPVKEILYLLEGAPRSPPRVTSTRSSPTTARVQWDEIPLENLRGWLVSYEVEYKSMTSRDKCASNTSSNTETVPVDQKMYELTRLDPGLQYCVRVAGRTRAGVGPFSHTLIPWYVNSIFTVTFEIENCSGWIAQEPEKIMTDLAREFSRGIELTCRCKIPNTYIIDGKLMCVNQELMIYGGRIISTNDRDSSNLLADFEKWLSSKPVIIAKGDMLKNPMNEKSTTEPKGTPRINLPEQNEDIHVSIIGGIAGVAAILLLLIVTGIVTILVLWKRRNLCTFSNKLATRITNTTSDHNSSCFPIPLPSGLAMDHAKPLKSTSNKQHLEEMETPVDYEMPEVHTENVYEDPDKVMESMALDSSYNYQEMAAGAGVYDGEKSAEENYSYIQ